jgi:hypothetical protein
MVGNRRRKLGARCSGRGPRRIRSPSCTISARRTHDREAGLEFVGRRGRFRARCSAIGLQVSPNSSRSHPLCRVVLRNCPQSGSSNRDCAREQKRALDRAPGSDHLEVGPVDSTRCTDGNHSDGRCFRTTDGGSKGSGCPLLRTRLARIDNIKATWATHNHS